MWTRIGVLLVVVAAVLLWWGRREEHARAARERESLAEAPPRRATSTAPPPRTATDEPPDDPPERGPCTLRLRVVDQATGQPVASEVHLWRLDAPATEHWTRGDRRHVSLIVGEGGKTVDGLPAGRYRAVCEAQLRAEEAPPAFVVEGPRTDVEIRVRLPREFEVRLRVVDERGRPVTRGCIADFTEAAIGDETPPAWVVPRRRADSLLPERPEQESIFETEERPVSAESGLYRLGTMREDHGSFRRTRQWVLGRLHETCVLVSVDGTIGADRTYVGVVVPLGRIREVIRLPGGGDPDEIQIYATCAAVPEGLAAWDRLAVDVSAHLDGYETLVFEYRVAGPNEVRVMRPK